MTISPETAAVVEAYIACEQWGKLRPQGPIFTLPSVEAWLSCAPVGSVLTTADKSLHPDECCCPVGMSERHWQAVEPGVWASGVSIPHKWRERRSSHDMLALWPLWYDGSDSMVDGEVVFVIDATAEGAAS